MTQAARKRRPARVPPTRVDSVTVPRALVETTVQLILDSFRAGEVFGLVSQWDAAVPGPLVARQPPAQAEGATA